MARRRRHVHRPLRRKGPTRDPYERFLVVCEGSRTEPEYIRKLCRSRSVNPANYKIVGDCANHPRGIVREAIRQFNEAKDFDAVFCVFDRDGHAHYQDAIDQVHSKVLRRGRGMPPAKFQAITSDPAFEYWLLLHFENNDAPYHPAGGRSASDQLVNRLRTHIPHYSKDGAMLFDCTCDELATALTRSRRIAEHAQHTGSENPSTRMHLLIEYILQLQERD